MMKNCVENLEGLTYKKVEENIKLLLECDDR